MSDWLRPEVIVPAIPLCQLGKWNDRRHAAAAGTGGRYAVAARCRPHRHAGERARSAVREVDTANRREVRIAGRRVHAFRRIFKTALVGAGVAGRGRKLDALGCTLFRNGICSAFAVAKWLRCTRRNRRRLPLTMHRGSIFQMRSGIFPRSSGLSCSCITTWG